MTKYLNSASDLVSFHGYFRMFILTIIGDCSRLFRMDVFLPYPMPTSVIYLVEGMQVYRYSADVHSRYHARLDSYSLYRLLSLFYQTMGGYIKFQFYVRVVGTQRWFTGNYTLHVFLVVISFSCEWVPAVFWSVRILLTQLLELWFSPTMRSSWIESLAMGMNLLVWTDDYILFSVLTSEVYERILISEGAAYYVGKHCNTRSQNFKDDYFYMLLKQLPYTIDFTKVYFFIHKIPITSICSSLPTAEYSRLIFDRGKEIEDVERFSSYNRNVSKFYITSYLFDSNGLIFTDACDDKYAHEFILKLVYHLLLLLGISNVFEFDIKGNRCDASKLVNEMSQQDYILRSALILQMARKNEFGSAPELYGQLIITVTSLAQMVKAGEKFMKMEIPTKISAMLFVWDLIILRESNLLVFSYEFEFTVFSFGLWSMEGDSSYAFTEFRLGGPISISCHDIRMFSSDFYMVGNWKRSRFIQQHGYGMCILQTLNITSL
ncbi:hypothetical protein MKW98_023451 [Papaver atlanticum]|uniref:Uncharacterized protein n=1 Tax=Papaver atlanticum TaxID=357466 RepID=A0AAD4SYY3_9MAGN|nr:hypothetical protein MKW98_023451 [Papaver atlanticum]